MSFTLRRLAVFAVFAVISGCQQSQPPANPISPVMEQPPVPTVPSVVTPDDDKQPADPVVNNNPIPEPPKTNVPASIPVATEKTIAEKAMATIWEHRRSQWKALVNDISHTKSSLKKAIISDDAKLISNHRNTIYSFQKELLRSLNAPLDIPSFDPELFKVGQLGKLDGVSTIVGTFSAQQVIKVFQVLKKTTDGELLVMTTYELGYGAQTRLNAQLRMGKKLDREYEPVLFKVVGVDTTALIDGGRFPLNLPPLVVTGTYTYETVSGGSQTIFKLHSVDPRSPFTNENDLKDFIAAADSDYSISLTEDEQAKSDAARQKHASELAQTQKLEMDEKARQQSNLRARRSQSWLENGKILLKKDNFTGARKQFEKAISEDPDSDSAKEAAALIDKLP